MKKKKSKSVEREIKRLTDHMRKNQDSLMECFHLTPEQFEEHIRLVQEIDSISEDDGRPQFIRRDITRGHTEDNLELVTNLTYKMLNKIREMKTPVDDITENTDEE